jgi:outer membrane protein assembly factor BamE (lipoprotein component of BamABCDE complex)
MKFMNNKTVLLRYILGMVVAGVLTILSACLFDSNRQPLVSKDPKSLQLFDKSTAFPYQANVNRITFIADRSIQLKEGMNGDEVLEIIGNPDEVWVFAYPFEKPKGWFWYYNIKKRYPNAPDDEDRGVTLYFTQDGLLKDIDKKLE